MIVVAESGRLRLITQTDHAFFAADLLSLWREGGLPSHSRRAQLLFAVREHDNGWREADAAPTRDPQSDRPGDFRRIPSRLRMEIWERGATRNAEEDAYPALLITRHALALHAERRGEADWQDFFSRMDVRREELEAASGLSPEELEGDYAWLDLADRLSLGVCASWGDAFDRSGVRARFLDGTLRIHPFPLAGATTFRVNCRSIPDRAYAGDADLGAEVAAARWENAPIRVAPW